jgi:ABC-type transporter Mla MlaB component
LITKSIERNPRAALHASAQQALEFDVPVTLEREDELSTIRLEGEVGIASAADLKSQLIQALGCGKQVRVSLQSVTDLDVTAVELLWAARREAKASSVAFAIDGPIPSMVLSSLLQAGFDDFAAEVDVAQASKGNSWIQ